MACRLPYRRVVAILRTVAVAACPLAIAACATVGQVTTLADPACRETVTAALRKILAAQDEKPPVAAQLAESATRGLRASELGPRPFLVASPSGTDYAFFVQVERDTCMLRLYGRQKGFVSYTNNLTYIATEPLAGCRCAE
jgi:hypothetical protein